MPKKKRIVSGEAAPKKDPAEADEASPPQDDSPTVPPIVAIGASAGGLEAFEKFFGNMPPDSGLAFVLVQHLDPTRESILPELVERYTRMAVSVVQDNQPVASNHVYIIPPNRDIALLQGVLHLIEPTSPRGTRLPIDYFFRSLAQDQKERAIGIVLSGTGTDGTLGVRAIKGEAGLVVAQEPGSAQYDGMPRSAIATGLVDYVLSPEQMPERLIGYEHDVLALGGHKRVVPPPGILDSLDKIMVLVRAQTGHDFSRYKQNTILRRVERRMVVNQIDNVREYLRYLQQSPLEAETLFKEMLIGVTNFFRDPLSFDALRQKVVPALFENRPEREGLRVWVPGCSTGEEAYSIAMLVREHLDNIGRSWPVQIFATDIDNDAVEVARPGIYPQSIAADVPQKTLQRFFTRENDRYQVVKSVREMLVFAVQSVIKDPPFSNLDLISCRNLLIYLQADLQKKLLPVFHYALKPDGFLFLGNSEGVGEMTYDFPVFDRKARIFRRKGGMSRLGHGFGLAVPLLAGAKGDGKPLMPEKAISPRELTERLVLKRFAPACVIINEKCDVLYTHGRTGKYLEPVSGEASLNILKMARDGLRIELTTAIRKALTQKEEVHHERLRVRGEGEDFFVNLTVGPVEDPPSMRGLLWVVLEDLAPGPEDGGEEGEATDLPAHGARRVAELEHELHSTKEYLQTTVEELETSNEELTSTNEELQTSNEELQSTNEELQTSQEELQSVNEELMTVNTELETKMDQLGKANNDLANIMEATEVGIVLLDEKLQVQRFTPAATAVLTLAEADIGRPLEHIGTRLDYRHLVHDAEAVLDTLDAKESEIRTTDGRWYALRITPYRTTEHMVDGVVLRFVSIDEQRRSQQLRKLSRAIEQSHGIVLVTDRGGHIEYVNPRFTEVTGYTLEDVAGHTPRVVKSGEHDAAFYRSLWETISAGNVWRGDLRNRKKNGQLFWVSAVVSPVTDETGHITHFVAAQEETTERRELEETLRASEALHRLTLSSISDAIFITDDYGRLTYVCPNVDTIFGRSHAEVQALGNIRHLLGDGAITPAALGGEQELTNIEREITDKRGHRHALLVNVKRVDINGGTTLYACRDVTKRREAEERLRRNEERYLLAMRAAGIGSWDWDITTGDLVWSETIEPIFGFEPGGFGRTYEAFLACVHPEDRQFVVDAVDACVKEGKDYAIEHRIVWPDGSVRRVLEKGDVVRGEGGEAVRMLGVVQDLGEK